MSPYQGPYYDSLLGLWKSTNSVGNINTVNYHKTIWKQTKKALENGAGSYLYRQLYFRSVVTTLISPFLLLKMQKVFYKVYNLVILNVGYRKLIKLLKSQEKPNYKLIFAKGVL